MKFDSVREASLDYSVTIEHEHRDAEHEHEKESQNRAVHTKDGLRGFRNGKSIVRLR